MKTSARNRPTALHDH